MAVLNVGATHEASTKAIQVTGTNNFAAAITGDAAFKIAEILVQKPANTVLTCYLVIVSDSIPTAVVLFVSSVDEDNNGVTSALYLEESNITVPTNGTLFFVSSGEEDGAKRVCVVANRVDS